jgi:hypothetical protein
MPTKAELVAFASSAGVDVSETWTKADIEAALASAGFDPDYLAGDDDVSDTGTDTEENVAETILRTSSDARFSTYTEVEVDTDERPRPGRLVEQERGEPDEGEGVAFEDR